MNKDHIIIVLSLLSVTLIIYIFAFKQKEIVMSEPIVKTVIEEKIVYVTEPTVKKDIEQIESIDTKKQVIVYPEMQLPVTNNNEYVITNTTDSQGRFLIELTSIEKPSNKDLFARRIVLRGKIEDGDYKGNFMFVTPPAILKDISQVKIKVTDAISGESYSEIAYCFESLESGYDYSMNIIYSNGFQCSTQEIGQAVALPKPSEEQNKKLLEKMATFQSSAQKSDTL